VSESRILTGDQLARMLCDAMGIKPHGIAKIVIFCEPQKAARIEITKYATDDVGIVFGNTLQSYSLVKTLFPGDAS
jgi:hypothetical protein